MHTWFWFCPTTSTVNVDISLGLNITTVAYVSSSWDNLGPNWWNRLHMDRWGSRRWIMILMIKNLVFKASCCTYTMLAGFLRTVEPFTFQRLLSCLHAVVTKKRTGKWKQQQRETDFSSQFQSLKIWKCYERKLHSLLKQVTTDRFHTSKNKSKKQITKNITFFLHTQRACLAWAYGESFIRGWAAPVHSILCVLGAEGGHRRKTAQPHLAWRHYQVACMNHTSSPHIPAHILLSVKI